MFRIKSKEKIIQDEINAIVLKLTEDYTDVEICEIVNSIKERSLAYLKHRMEHLSNELQVCEQSIKKINGN